MKKSLVVFTALTPVVVVAFWACGGGASAPARTSASSAASSSPSASASTPPVATATASAVAKSSADPEPDMPIEFMTAMADSNALMLKGVNLLLGGVTHATPCDQAAADLSKLAADPINRKIETKFAAEYAKLSPAMQDVMAPQLVVARTNLKGIGTHPPPAKTTDAGAAPMCSSDPKMQVALESFRMLMSLGLSTAH